MLKLRVEDFRGDCHEAPLTAALFDTLERLIERHNRKPLNADDSDLAGTALSIAPKSSVGSRTRSRSARVRETR